jgi:hypothetical protein
MNFPEIVDIALPSEGVFHNLVFVSIRKTYPMQAYKIMHGLWGMGQMMFTKYIVVVDDDVDVHNTSEVLFRLCANTDPQRDSIFTRGPSDVLDHATSEIASPREIEQWQRSSGMHDGIISRGKTANSASTRRGKFRAKASNAPGRRSSRWMPR